MYSRVLEHNAHHHRFFSITKSKQHIFFLSFLQSHCVQVSVQHLLQLIVFEIGKPLDLKKLPNPNNVFFVCVCVCCKSTMNVYLITVFWCFFLKFPSLFPLIIQGACRGRSLLICLSGLLLVGRNELKVDAEKQTSEHV